MNKQKLFCALLVIAGVVLVYLATDYAKTSQGSMFGEVVARTLVWLLAASVLAGHLRIPGMTPLQKRFDMWLIFGVVFWCAAVSKSIDAYEFAQEEKKKANEIVTAANQWKTTADNLAARLEAGETIDSSSYGQIALHLKMNPEQPLEKIYEAFFARTAGLSVRFAKSVEQVNLGEALAPSTMTNPDRARAVRARVAVTRRAIADIAKDETVLKLELEEVLKARKAKTNRGVSLDILRKSIQEKIDKANQFYAIEDAVFATVDDLLALGIENYGGIQLHEDQLSFEDDEVMNRYNNLHAHLDELSQQEEKALQESEAKTSQGIEELRAFSE